MIGARQRSFVAPRGEWVCLTWGVRLCNWPKPTTMHRMGRLNRGNMLWRLIVSSPWEPRNVICVGCLKAATWSTPVR